MSSSWDEMMKKDIPQVAKEKTPFETRYQNWQTWDIHGATWSPSYNKDGILRPWNYERQRLYKMLGIKVIKKYKEGAHGSYKTGQYQVTCDSSNTYTISEKTSSWHKTDIHYIIGVDKSKITDVKNYEKIKNKVDDFLKEAEQKFGDNSDAGFGNINPLGKSVAPAYFNWKERLSIVWKNELSWFAVRLVLIIPAPIYLIKRIVFHVNYNKKFSQYIPFVSAYFEQVKELEAEIKQVINFD